VGFSAQQLNLSIILLHAIVCIAVQL
jgi:hypothetical protein